MRNLCLMSVAISGIFIMRRQSERVRAHENGDVPPPAPANWQEIIANLEARVQRAEEEARIARGQVPGPVPAAEVPPFPAPVVAPPLRDVHREPLYECRRIAKVTAWSLVSQRQGGIRPLPLLLIRASALTLS